MQADMPNLAKGPRREDWSRGQGGPARKKRRKGEAGAKRNEAQRKSRDEKEEKRACRQARWQPCGVELLERPFKKI